MTSPICRLGSFTPKKDWAGVAADLNAMAGTHALGVVVDLRGNASDDYAGAAQMLGFLVPNDTSLLKYAPASKAAAPALPHLDGPLIVLTNGQTAGAAEALAASLRVDGAVVVGRATAGTGFEEGQALRWRGPALRHRPSPVAQRHSTRPVTRTSR